MMERKHFWIRISSGLFPRAGHGSTRMYPRDYRDYAEIESLPSHPARMPKCVSGKLSLNHRVFTRGRYHAFDPKLYAPCSELHIIRKRSQSHITYNPHTHHVIRITYIFSKLNLGFNTNYRAVRNNQCSNIAIYQEKFLYNKYTYMYACVCMYVCTYCGKKEIWEWS